MKETEILIVGFGFSAIPLLRELDISGVEYTIISEKDGSVWAGLARSGALDFDLVSSYYTSYYTIDLVKDFGEDRYPTAKEFYEMHLRYYRQYADQIIDDFVTLIDNQGDHSLVHTRGGGCYKAKKVVISTAFKRKMHESLNKFDFSIRNKTVVVDNFGDSANLIMAKLVTGDNKIVCLQNGFIALDKQLQIGNITYTLDQLEAHQLASHFKSLYRTWIGNNFNFVNPYKIFSKNKWIAAWRSVVHPVQYLLGRLFTPHYFNVRYDSNNRVYSADRPIGAALPNGFVVVKTWPIDEYARQFSGNLSEHIKEGYLLNDILFFVSEGIVSLWNKESAKIDRNQKTIECDGQSIPYDYLIEGDVETPRLPRITYASSNKTSDYKYVYRNCYLGAIPKEISNIYLLGYTRPITGGLSNITEMQSLLIHRMITDEPFASAMRKNLEGKLAQYNRKYYLTDDSQPRDHLVWSGFFTQDVARELGIDAALKSCRSIKDVLKYFIYSNNADKFRQTGRYKIEKCTEFVDHVFTQHKGFKPIWQMLLIYVSYQVLFIAVAASLFFNNWIGGWTLAAVLLFQFLFSQWLMILIANCAPFYMAKLFSFLLYLPLLMDPRTALMIFPLDFIITFIMRQLPRARYTFNDLKCKKRYRSFFARYKEIYNQLRQPNTPLPKL